MSLTKPITIPDVFASGTDPAAITTIPDQDPGDGSISWFGGYPLSNMEPILSGGTNVSGPGTNAILNAYCQHLYWISNGQAYPYSSSFDTGANGPYPVGTKVISSDGAGYWLKYANASSAIDPESSTGPTAWLPVGFTGITALGSIAATTTLTPLEAARPVISANTATGSGATLVLPNWPAVSWTLINTNASGAAIPIQIGAATISLPPLGPTQAMGVVNYNGQPIITFQPAAALPMSVTPDPSKLAQRDGTGQLFATRFNQNSPSNENPNFTSLFVEANSDGFLRKATIAAVIQQMGLAILNGPSFRGNPTAPTPSAGNNSTSIATTAFVQGLGATKEPLSQTSSGIGQKIALTGPGSSGADSVTLPAGGTWEWDGLVVNINGTNPQSMRPSGSYAVAGVSNGGTTISYIASDGGATRLYVWAKRIA